LDENWKFLIPYVCGSRHPSINDNTAFSQRLIESESFLPCGILASWIYVREGGDKMWEDEGRKRMDGKGMVQRTKIRGA